MSSSPKAVASAGDRMLESVRALAFPRATGTEGAIHALELLEERLRALGLTVRNEPFAFDPRPLRRGIPALLVLASGSILVGAAAAHPLPWAGAALALALPPLMVLARRRPRFDRGRGAESVNMVAEPGDRAPDAGAAPRAGPEGRRIVVVAHWDSKSQWCSFALRTALCVAAALAALVFFAAALAAPHGALRPVSGALAAVAIAMAAMPGYGNRSPGALDNASGVAVALELAERVARRPVDGAHVLWVLTGAEEDGLVGADRYAARHRDEHEPGRDLVINLDTVGGRGPLIVTDHEWRRGPATLLVQAFRRAARELEIPLVRRRVPFPAAVDSFPFARQGLAAVTLASGTLLSTYRHLHRPADGPHLVDVRSLERAADLTERAIRSLAAGGEEPATVTRGGSEGQQRP